MMMTTVVIILLVVTIKSSSKHQSGAKVKIVKEDSVTGISEAWVVTEAAAITKWGAIV